ncbi:hypothetical protein FOPG_17225 [Fusarium oxysporum f. sp. conglutinans race 2 54008]|uniref:Uncharacterized protein n=1 Tax=Fusarium oxysporum f. sp. conglutinans race 2 54008 TaxID=1089457 RepID=X0GTB8_FUSOX|nr:hypothetical protein FOPG_17225 [Fusarium oxysporum f. sp. conglutinans race 2 54008]
MPEQQYPDYKLQPEVFQAWLRKRFSDSSIEVKCRHGNFVFNLPDNEEINDRFVNYGAKALCLNGRARSSAMRLATVGVCVNFTLFQLKAGW